MLMLLGTFLAVVGLTYGAVVLWLGLLNRRDRRQATLLGAALKPFTSPNLRGRVAVQARSALLAPRHVVTVDMRGCSREEIWEAVARLSRCLPPHVRLVVDSTVDPQFPTRLTVETESADPLCHPSRPSVATG